MAFDNPQDETVRSILTETKTIAIVGLSDNKARDSYQVANYLQQHGYHIIPVNPNVDQVLGERAFSNLSEISERVDVIDIFRRSDALADVIRDARHLPTAVIWAQLGVFDEEAANMAKEDGRTMIMDRCIKIEHRRLIPS